MKSGDRLNKIAISYDSDRCLYARSIWADCTLCAASCPSGAISFNASHKPPAVNPDQCMQCGQCLSACPVEAFESISFSERKLFNRLSGKGDVRLQCFLPYDALSSLSKGLDTYQLGTCLAALSPGAMFELAADRVCELDTRRCSDCSLFARAGITLESNYTVAKALLADWGRSDNLVEAGGLFSGDEGEMPPEYANGSEGVPRMFSSLMEDSYNVQGSHEDEREEELPYVSDVLRDNVHALFKKRDTSEVHANPIHVNRKRSVLPSWRSRLKNTWRQMEGQVTEGYPWPVLTVDDKRCQACGMCMQFCPTGSIELLQGDGEFIHTMVPAACIDCQLCVLSCPNHALTRTYQLVYDPFANYECSSRPATPCPRCGLPVFEGEGPLCRLCSSNHDAVSLEDRVRKQMEQLSKASQGNGGI